MVDNIDTEDTALAERNRISREIILEGSKDPDNYVMPDGRTLTETRNAIDAAQRAELSELEESTAMHTRREGMQDAVLLDNAELKVNETGQILIHPAQKETPAVQSEPPAETTDTEIEEGL